MKPSSVVLVAAVALAAVPLHSQTSQHKPSFEVVSIKPSPPPGSGPLRIGGGVQGDRFSLSGATLRMLLQIAFSRPENNPLSGQLQIVGGPSWMESDRYDVTAKADCSGGTFSRQQLPPMMQSLLEDRFQLKAHMETRELPVYDLVVMKDGPKIKRSADQTTPSFAATLPGPCEAAQGPPPAPPPLPPGGFRPDTPMPRGTLMMMMSNNGMTLRASAAPFANLVRMLQQQLGRAVVDKTGLTGLFDFELTFNPDGLQSPFGRGVPLPPPPPPDGTPASAPVTAADPVASIFTSVQQLGLKLESTKAPVEVLVIDSVEKPTEN
jgi:uncharacterized protein (TIGR03435 family)